MKETTLLTNDVLTQVPVLGEWSEMIAEKFELAPERTFSLSLMLEEAVVNVMNYAYPLKEDMPITLSAEKINDEDIKFVIDDEGVPFDPTKAEDPDTTLSAEERPIGGLGIMLVKQYSKSITYERKDGHNILTIIF